MAFEEVEDLPPDINQSGGMTAMPRALMILLGLMAVFLAAQGIQPIRSTFAASFMALNVVIVVFPIQRRLAKHIPRFLASLAAGLVALSVLVAAVWSIGWTIARLVQELPKYSAEFSQLITQIVDFAKRYNIDTNIIAEQVLNQLRGLNLSSIVAPLTGIASGMTSFIGILLMIALVLIFMVMDSVGFSERMRRLGERHNPTLAWALTSFAHGTRRYWIVTTIFGLIVAGCNFVLLTILGVPMPVVWALFSFVTNYIPNIGFIIGIIPPVMMALLANDPLTALWVIIGYCVFNVVIQVLLQPKFAGDAVGITPTIAILSLLIWAYVLGPLGAILAIPATLLVKTLFIDIDPRNRWLNAFIASNPGTSDQDPIRLSKLLDRTKRIRKLTARVQRPGVTAEEAEAAHRELAALTEEAEASDGESTDM